MLFGTYTRANSTLSPVKQPTTALGHQLVLGDVLNIFYIAVKADPITYALLLKVSANLVQQSNWNSWLVTPRPSENS